MPGPYCLCCSSSPSVPHQHWYPYCRPMKSNPSSTQRVAQTYVVMHPESERVGRGGDTDNVDRSWFKRYAVDAIPHSTRSHEAILYYCSFAMAVRAIVLIVGEYSEIYYAMLPGIRTHKEKQSSIRVVGYVNIFFCPPEVSCPKNRNLHPGHGLRNPPIRGRRSNPSARLMMRRVIAVGAAELRRTIIVGG